MNEDSGAHAIVLAIVGRNANDSQTGSAQSTRRFVGNDWGVFAFPYRAKIARAFREQRAARRTALMPGLNQDIRGL